MAWEQSIDKAFQVSATFICRQIVRRKQKQGKERKCL